MPIRQQLVSFFVTTNISGVATASIQVPGTFGGAVPADPSNLRFFKKAALWAPSFVDGDLVDQIKVLDTDGLVPVPARAAFPNYPTILDFTEDNPAGANVVPGVYLQPNSPVEIAPFDDSVAQIPSGLYLSMRFTAGAISLGRVFRGRIYWGKYSAT